MVSQGRFDNLVAAAGRAMNADGAAVYLLDADGIAHCVAADGDFEASLPPALALHAAGSFFIGHTSAGRCLNAAEIRHLDRRAGFLCIWRDTESASSGAQSYVLQYMANLATDQLELERLQEAFAQTRIDATERETRLRLLESVVINANDAVLITEAEPIDLPGPRILYANAAFTRTTGYSQEEILGQTPRILQGAATDGDARRRLRAALSDWRPVEIELLNYRKDGSPFWVELSIVPIADDSGYYTHWVSVQRDISQRKAAAEAAERIRLTEAHNEALQIEIAERKRAEARLAHAAFHDDLTTLRNRASFADRLAMSLARARRGDGYRCAIIFLDLDGFKVVNDTLGHRIGDLMLIEVAHRLSACARAQDTLSRMGGDEFALLLDDVADVGVAVGIAERILAELDVPIHLAGKDVVPNASLGINMIDARYAMPEESLRDADTAMYRAKRDGGSRYAIFQPEMYADALATLHTRLELRNALENDEFVLLYQPLVDMVTGQMCGVEALIRWNHSTRGVVAPADFVPLAEEGGLIVALGSWVLLNACRQIRSWLRDFTVAEDFAVSVNVSPRQLTAPGFFEDVVRALTETELPAQRLQLEITESVFVEQAGRSGALLQRLRSMGVRIAFDDFGTGYSSLSYLERYRIDSLKIDQSFVRRLVDGEANAAIVRMVIGLARALQMDVTAEGVENRDQHDRLLASGCRYAQGYLYSPPAPATTIVERLGQARPFALR